MWVSDHDMLAELNSVMSECLSLGYLSVGTELQEAAVVRLRTIRERVEQRRLASIEQQAEESANLAWVIGCYTDGVMSFLSMWVHAKSDRMESAWEALIEAQDAIETGLRLRYIKGYHDLAVAIDIISNLMFPPCMYISSSIQFKSLSCSICGVECGECDHVPTQLYMGEMCHGIVREILHVDHVAIVHHPADRKLRFPALVDGNDLCSLTRRPRIVPGSDGGQSPITEPHATNNQVEPR